MFMSWYKKIISVNNRKGAIFNTGSHEDPLKIKILKSVFYMLEGTESQIFMCLGSLMADISLNNQIFYFQTGPYEDPPSKFRNSSFVMF